MAQKSATVDPAIVSCPVALPPSRASVSTATTSPSEVADSAMATSSGARVHPA